MWFRDYDNFDLNVLLKGRKKKKIISYLILLWLPFSSSLLIAGLPVTSRRPCWWSRTKAFLSYGN